MFIQKQNRLKVVAFYNKNRYVKFYAAIFQISNFKCSFTKKKPTPSNVIILLFLIDCRIMYIFLNYTFISHSNFKCKHSKHFKMYCIQNDNSITSTIQQYMFCYFCICKYCLHTRNNSIPY